MKKIFSSLLVVVMLVSLFIGIQANAAAGNYTVTLNTGANSYDGASATNIDVLVNITGITEATKLSSMTIKFTFDNTKFNFVAAPSNGSAGTAPISGVNSPKFLWNATGTVFKNAMNNVNGTFSVSTGIEDLGNGFSKAAVTFYGTNGFKLGEYYDMVEDDDDPQDTPFNPNGYYGKFTLTPKAPVSAGDTTFDVIVTPSDTNANDGGTPAALHNITGVDKTINFTSAAVNRTLTFDMAGGTGTQASAVVLDGTKFVAPTQPTKAGYNFAGWFNGLTEYVAGTTTISANATLTAHWTVISVTDLPIVAGDVVKGQGNHGYKNELNQTISGNVKAVALPGKVPATITDEASMIGHTFGIEFGGKFFPSKALAADIATNQGKYIIKLVDPTGKLTGKSFKVFNVFDGVKSGSFISVVGE